MQPWVANLVTPMMPVNTSVIDFLSRMVIKLTNGFYHHSLVVWIVKMVTGAQIRAARALIGWSATTLAQRSGLSYPTIQRAESVDGIPTMKTPSLFAIQRTLEDAGVVFLEDRELREGGPGVRLALGIKL